MMRRSAPDVNITAHRSTIATRSRRAPTCSIQPKIDLPRRAWIASEEGATLPRPAKLYGTQSRLLPKSSLPGGQLPRARKQRAVLGLVRHPADLDESAH